MIQVQDLKDQGSFKASNDNITWRVMPVPFKKGNTLSKGRPKGSRNLVSKRANDICEALNFNPIAEMINAAKEAKKTYENYAVIYEAICKGREMNGLFPTDDKADKYLSIYADTAAKVARHVFPTIKAIEPTTPSLTEGLSDTEKLQMAETAIKVLKARVDGSKPS